MGKSINRIYRDAIRKHEASKKGVSRIELGFKQTERNTAMKKIVVDNGFTSNGSDTAFQYNILKNEPLKIPKWIDMSY